MTSASLVAVVIPAHNEARLLPEVLRGIPGWVGLVVVVDDASDDGTPRVVEEWGDPRAVAVRRATRGGVGRAILDGYAVALERGADVVAVVAADGQMDLTELESVVAPVRSGEADYVQGTRFAGTRPRGSMPWTRWAGNVILRAATRWASGAHVSDSQCGFTAARAAFLRRLDVRRIPDGYGFPAFLRIEAHRMRARVREVPVSARYGSEVSGIRPLLDPPSICARILWRGVLRRLAACRRSDPLPASMLRSDARGETR